MDRTLILVKPDAFARGLTRRDHRPLRAQGAAHRRAAAHDRHARAGRAPLRRARRAAVLRRARRLHHLRADRGDGARGHRRGQGGAAGDRRDQPARGRHRHDPRRLRDRDGGQHGSRLGLAGVRRARGRRCSSRSSRGAYVLGGSIQYSALAHTRLGLAPAARAARAPRRPLRDPASRTRASSSRERTRQRWPSRTRCARRARRTAPERARPCSAATRSSCSTA